MNIVVKSSSRSTLKTRPFVATALMLAGLAGLANAQNAFTNRTVNLHAGPDRNYPTVSVVGPGAMVYVNGCLRNFNWCDVSSGPLRGWANARNLNYTYGGRPMAIYGNGARFGLPVVGYTMGSYWDTHYRAQPWYGTHRHNWHPSQAYVAPHGVVHQPDVQGFAPQVHARPVPVQQHFAPQHQQHSRPIVVQQHPQDNGHPQHRP